MAAPYVQPGFSGVVGPIIDAIDTAGNPCKIVAPGFVALGADGQPVTGGGPVSGPDATGANPTENPVFIAGIDQNGHVAPIQTTGGYIRTISEQLQGDATGTFATVIGGITDDDATTLPIVTDTDGYLYARTMGNILWNESTTPLAAAGTFTGPSRDSGFGATTKGIYSYFNAFFAADQTGTARIEGSNDNVAWYTVATDALAASTPLILQVPVMTRYHRVVLVNGATLQTVLHVNSSYSAT